MESTSRMRVWSDSKHPTEVGPQMQTQRWKESVIIRYVHSRRDGEMKRDRWGNGRNRSTLAKRRPNQMKMATWRISARFRQTDRNVTDGFGDGLIRYRHRAISFGPFLWSRTLLQILWKEMEDVKRDDLHILLPDD